MPFLANDFVGDPVATVGVIEETKKEVKKRVKHSIKGTGLADDPKRLFVCGSCVGPNPHHVEKAGGVLVGRDDNWSSVSTNVEENGDPYENLARAILSFPYEQPTERRAEWTAEQVKKSRADGVVFMYNWGCNFQTAVARMMSDIVKEKTGVPTTFVEVGELGRMEALEQSENRIEAFYRDAEVESMAGNIADISKDIPRFARERLEPLGDSVEINYVQADLNDIDSLSEIGPGSLDRMIMVIGDYEFF